MKSRRWKLLSVRLSLRLSKLSVQTFLRLMIFMVLFQNLFRKLSKNRVLLLTSLGPKWLRKNSVSVSRTFMKLPIRLRREARTFQLNILTLLFPRVILRLVVLVEPRSPRRRVAWRTLSKWVKTRRLLLIKCFLTLNSVGRPVIEVILSVSLRPLVPRTRRRIVTLPLTRVVRSGVFRKSVTLLLFRPTVFVVVAFRLIILLFIHRKLFRKSRLTLIPFRLAFLLFPTARGLILIVFVFLLLMKRSRRKNRLIFGLLKVMLLTRLRRLLMKLRLRVSLLRPVKSTVLRRGRPIPWVP